MDICFWSAEGYQSVEKMEMYRSRKQYNQSGEWCAKAFDNKAYRRD